MRKRRRIRMMLLLGVAALTTALGLVAYADDWFERTELDTVDLRFSIRGDEKPPPDIIVVGVDDDTFSELREQWPFPRSLHGKVIDRLHGDGAKVIAYDVQFTEPTEEKEDLALFDAAANAGNVVFATTEVEEDGSTAVLGGDANLKDIGAEAGNGLLPDDPGGIKRRMSHEQEKLKLFSVVAAEHAGTKVDPKDFDGPDGTEWIDYTGGPGNIREIPFSRVLRGQFKPGTFKDKIVVVGATAPTLKDVFPTSTSGDEVMSGPEVQAQAISTLRRDLPLQPAAGWVNVLAIILLALAAPLLSLKLKPGWAIGAAILLGVAWFGLAILLFNSGTIVDLLIPLATGLVSMVAALGVHYFTETRERRRTRALFARFVPENVVDQVLDRTDDDLRLGGVEREGTVMFSDLRGFTSFAESLPVTRVIEVLNRYLGEMSEAILNHGGTLVAYMGDGIMAVFGAPIEQPDHADRGLAAAREMLGPRLATFNQYLIDEGLHDEGFRMGVGLNSGPVMSGNVGSERRLEYTAIGDTTNTAARLEGMTKGTPHMLFAAESTRDMLTTPVDELFYVDEFEVRGREAKIRLWSLPEASDEPPAEAGAAAAATPGQNE
jgi:adenylate cyclase